ncbi:hypothetical protein HJC23_000025 [Cyclotella cryptica]|uniref:Uncharacterized protein n=1 Tax=Cyclotella cryptica TaxID=29204 RepID=A0ABD3P051_9STRA|eukprot:CCRYP_018408-RA/>CCRYP_018408-RA protein AED:0.18 eAED:0.18 QI:0/-1/0/1/-1/1/1/0/1244
MNSSFECTPSQPTLISAEGELSSFDDTCPSTRSTVSTPRTLGRCPTPSPLPADFKLTQRSKAPPQSQRAVRQEPGDKSAMSSFFEFASLSPSKAAAWEEAHDSKRHEELKRRLEREMSMGQTEDDCSLDDGFTDNYSADRNDQRANNHAAATLEEASSSAASSLPTQSSPSKPHNWDIDTLLEEHMRDIDDCDFGSLHRHHLGLGQTQTQTIQRMSGEYTKTSAHQNNGATLSYPSERMHVTVSDQSTISSPGWSTAHQTRTTAAPQTPTDDATSIKLTSQARKVDTKTTQNIAVQRPSTLQRNHASTIDAAVRQPTTPQYSTLAPSSNAAATTTKETLDVHAKLRSLQLQLNQVTTLNQTLQSRVNNDQLQIQHLMSAEEEARQEAALWEAKWRDDIGAAHRGSSHREVLLDDLRGALLQKTKEEVKELQSQLLDMQKSRQESTHDSVDMNLLATENEALRRELNKLSDGILGSPSSHNDAMQRLDRMAKTSRESEQKWAARVKDAEEKLDKLRREHKVLIGENERLKEELTRFARRAEEAEKRGEEMEMKLNRDRGEIDRLVKEKNALVEESRSCRSLVEKARADHETIRRDFERRWNEEKERHRAEMESVQGTKNDTVDRGCDAKPLTDETMEATLAQIAQENMTLKEENTGVSAENERLAKRCVDLERSLSDAVSNADDVRAALERAESRIVDLEREQADREGNMRRIEQELAAALLEEETIRRSVGEAAAEKDAIQQQLQTLQIEKEQLDSDMQSLCRENEMLQSQKASLEEYHVNAQDELRSWQFAKEELEAELSAASEENATLKSSNLAMKERLEERQSLLDSIRKSNAEDHLVEENRLLRSSLTGLEHQLRGVESALHAERLTLASTEHAREQAEKRIGELESQILLLQKDIESANNKTSSERSDHLRLDKQMNEMKKTILSLQEEISSTAITESQLQLELNQKQSEIANLRKQLDPIQQEKYRLELDNAMLTEEIKILRKNAWESGCDADEECRRTELVKRLEEKNEALAKCISSLQHDMMVIHSSSHSKSFEKPNNESTESRGIPSRVDYTVHDQDASSSKSLKSNAPVVSKDMLEQVHRARAAVKEIASVIKAQRQDISSNARSGDVLDSSQFLSPTALQKFDRSPPSAQFSAPASSIKPPAEITTEVYKQIPSNHPTRSMSIDRVIAPTLSYDGGTNLRMQLEDEHMAEKSAIKTKYRERIRCMRKEWEGERKAILSLLASPNSEAGVSIAL